MADAIFSVRIDEDTKASFANMAKEAGINNKEFMEQLISLYNLNKVSMASSINTESDITELQNISRRIVDIFANLIGRMDAVVNECDKKNAEVMEQCEKLKAAHTEELIKKENEKEKLKNDMEEMKEENKKLKNHIESNEEGNSNMKALNKIQEDRLKELEDKLANREEKLQHMDSLKKRCEALENENSQLKDIMENYKVNMEELQKKVKTLEHDNESMEKNLKKTYDDKMSMMKERLELDKSREILMLKEEKYNEVNKLQKEYGQEILCLTEQNRMCQETINRMKEKAK